MVLFSVIDTETTGLGIFGRPPCYDDFPLSIGVVVADLDEDIRLIKCLDSMYSVIRIPDPARARDTFRIHGISVENVESAPLPSEVCEKFLGMQDRHGFEAAGAWNHAFDRYFLDRLFQLSDVKNPPLRWVEMQPRRYARLDDHVPCIACDDIRRLPGHNALNDCMRALGVFASGHGYELDISGIKSFKNTSE